jgi:hypothetical protein
VANEQRPEWEAWRQEQQTRDQRRLDTKTAEIARARAAKTWRQEQERVKTDLELREQREAARQEAARLEAEQARLAMDVVL